MTSKSDHNPFFDRMPHERRAVLKWSMLAGGAALANVTQNPQVFAGPAQAKEEKAQEAVERATRGMPAPHIKDIKVIEVGGGGVNDSTIVKVTTDQAGLYG